MVLAKLGHAKIKNLVKVVIDSWALGKPGHFDRLHLTSLSYRNFLTLLPFSTA
jgi:hypothetical protein